MFGREKLSTVLCVFILLFFTLSLSPIILAQDETNDAKIIERYKLMLSQKPKEGSTFDRLYQFYLEGPGLEKMVTDYQTEAQSNPNDANLQLILGHLYKRLGKDTEALTAYQRATTLAPNDYYTYFALGQFYVRMRKNEEAIRELTKSITLSERSQLVSPEELTAIYKALGHAYYSRDKLDEAIQAWEKISELDPQNIFARIELADLFYEQQLYPQAIAQHQAILEIKKDDPYRKCLSLREIGKIHEDTSEYEEARKRYDEALALTAPGNWLRKDLQQRIIGIYAADGNWEGLITYYQDKLEAIPNDPELLGLLASAYIENQQLDEGIGAYRKGLELAPTETGLRLNLISALRDAEKLEDATTEYEVLTEQQSDDFGIYRELGKLYVQLENIDKAKAVYQRMIDRDPQNASTYLILAEIYTGHEWIDDAVAQYEKAILLAPDNLDYIEFFGDFYFRQDNREKAVETWNQMVADSKSTAENYDRLARLLQAKKFSTEAIEMSKKAVELMPDTYKYREALAKRYLENQEYEDALKEYAEAKKLAPNAFFAEQMDDQRIEIYQQQGTLLEKIGALEDQLKQQTGTAEQTFTLQMRLAKMYIKLGNFTYALEVLLEAKKLQPDDIVVNRRLAEVYTKHGRQDDANTIYTHLIEVDAANAREYYANIARAHLNTSNFEAATAAAKQVVAHGPRNPEGHQLLAQIARNAGDYDTAIDSLKQAVRLRSDATDIRSELATIYKLSGNLQQALEQYWQCWKLSNSVSDKLTFVKPLSDLYYDLGQHNDFQERLKQLSKVDSSSVAPVLALASVYHDIGDLSNAKFQLARALDRQPDNPELLQQLVKISVELGDADEALSYQQQLVKAHPDVRHQRKLGELLFDAGREQEAVQAWTKLLHTKNQSLEAEIKLSSILIRHGLLEEALIILDRGAEKATDAKDIYKIGAMLVEMNEFERAQPHFQRILEMPEPPTKTGSATATAHMPQAITYTPYGPAAISMGNLNLPRNLVYQIQGQPYYSRRRTQSWMPNSFEEAQAGALVQLTTIAQQQGKLNGLIEQYEADAAANPKDIQTLETLLQIYSLIQNAEKVNEITEQLLSVSPNDPMYQSMRLNQFTEQHLDYETWKTQYDKMTALTPDMRIWHAIQYASRSFYAGNMDNAEKVFSNLENMKLTDTGAALMLIPILVELGKIDQAEKLLAQVQTPVNTTGSPTSTVSATPFPMQQQGFYNQIHSTLAVAYLHNGQTDKAIEYFWTHLERSKPKTINSKRVAPLAFASYSSGGYTPVQSSFPSPTMYYNQNRLDFLQGFFSFALINNQQEALYEKLKAELDKAKEKERIYPSLALSYCYWWGGKRNEALEILSSLQKEYPDDMTLKQNTIFVSTHTGEYNAALTLLKELSEVDPRNRRQYTDLTLRLAIHTGDTATVRELMTKLLNSPSGTRELYQFSQKLQNAGLTQFALAVAKKAVDLAKGERDPNFLIQLSQHLERLGRGQDAARLAERALRFANRRDRYGQTLHHWNIQNASRLVRNFSVTKNREPKLLEAAKKNPKSFQAQYNLATFYESAKQYQKASEAFQAALALRPKDGTTRQRYAQMLMQNKQAKDAVDQYNIILKENANLFTYNSHQVVEAYFQAGKVSELVTLAKEMIVPSVGQSSTNNFARSAAQRCLRHNNPKAAIEIYEKIIKASPNDPYISYVYRDLASAYVNVGERDKAIQFLRKNLENKNIGQVSHSYTQIEIVLQLIELHKASGKLKDLLTEYEQKLEKKPSDRFLIFPVALMKIGFKDLEGSDVFIDKLFSNSSMRGNFEWANRLADAYRTAGDRDREIRVLEIATQKVNPQHSWGISEVYQKLGAAYIHKGDKTKGRDTFRKMGAILMSHGGGGFWEKEQLAQTYMQHAMWEDAKALYTDISNDLSASQGNREQAQRQLMMIKQMSRGLTTTTQSPKKTQNMNIGAQKALAQQHLRNGQNNKAIQIYEQVVKAVPEDFEARSQLATLYARQKQYGKALETWQALLKADPENSKYQDGLIKAYQASGKFDVALELAQKYLAAEPESSVHHARIARLYSTNGQVKKAIDAYKKTIELKPGDRYIYEALARLYTHNNEYDLAEKTYKEAMKYVDRDWDKGHLERQLMDLYRRQGKLEEVLKEAEEKGTLTLKMQSELAKQYQDKGEHDKAISAYKKALTLTSQDHERDNISYQLMVEYAKIGEDKLALDLFDKAYNPNAVYTGGVSISTSGSSQMSISFGNDNIRKNLIKIYQNQGKLDKLRTLFEERLKADQDNPATLEILAEVYRNAKDNNKAAETYQALSKVQPNNVRSYFYAAAALNKSGKPDLAKQLLSQGEAAYASGGGRSDTWFLAALAIICFDGELYPQAVKFAEDAVAKSSRHGGFNDTNLYGLLGKCYFATKQYEEAANTYQQIANLARSDWERKEAEKAVQRAYREGNLHETRIPKLVKMAEENPDDPDVRLNLAKSYEASEKVDEAIAQYEKLIELQPDNSEWHQTIGDLYQKSRQTQGAERLAKVVSAYEKALKLEPNSYKLYTQLGQTHKHGSEFSKAEAVYRRALDAQLSAYEHDSMIREIWTLYVSQKKQKEGIAVLEELKSKMKTSATLHELLAEAYKNLGDTENAEVVYAQWLEIRQADLKKRQYHGDYNRLAEQLLNLNIYPDVALDYAQRAVKDGDDPKYGLTLGLAYLANEQYDEALEQLKGSLSTMNPEDMKRRLFSRISAFSKNAKDKESFVKLTTELINTIPTNTTNQLKTNLDLAEFCREHGLTEFAKTYMNKTGFIPEDTWLFLGPFDNTKGVGYNTTYISEGTKEIDISAKYDGMNGQVSWQKITDDTFDGFVDFGQDDNWYTGYAWTTIVSPDERKAQIRFDSDDQGKIWLNGKKIYAHRRNRGASIDRRTIPVKLMVGENTILVKVCNETLPWGFYLRITDSEGEPFEDLKFNGSKEN